MNKFKKSSNILRCIRLRRKDLKNYLSPQQNREISLNVLDKNNQGSVLLITLLIMSSIMTIAFAASSVIMNNIYMSRTQVDSSKAFYAAETGAERVLRIVRMKLFTNNCDMANKYINFDSGNCTNTLDSAKVTLPSNQSYYYVVYNGSAAHFQSFGSSASGVKRAIDISFE